jgi:hypothetical protein
MKHNIVSSYVLGASKGGSTTPRFTANADDNTLEPVDPIISAKYCWVGNRRISTLHGGCYNLQRNALFQE